MFSASLCLCVSILKLNTEAQRRREQQTQNFLLFYPAYPAACDPAYPVIFLLYCFMLFVFFVLSLRYLCGGKYLFVVDFKIGAAGN